MTEPSVVPLVPLDLDKRRYLRLDINALCLAEVDLCAFWQKEMSVYDALLQTPIRLNDLAILVLHGLRHADPTLSLPEVKGMLNHSTVPVILQAVTDAWTKATQAAEPAQGDPSPADPPGAASTGDTSGLTGVSTSASVSTSSGN
jgi:hypothetical protein